MYTQKACVLTNKKNTFQHRSLKNYKYFIHSLKCYARTYLMDLTSQLLYHIEGTARYACLLLVPVEGFGLFSPFMHNI